MKDNIFVTPDTMKYLPSTESPEPDFDDMHFLGFVPNQTLEEVLKDILELNENLSEGKLCQTFRLDLRNENRKYFQLRDFKTRSHIAS